MSEILKFDRQNKVAVLTLNRPKTLNALSHELRDALADALKQCHEDDAIGAIVLTGEGRGFCSGADLTGPRPELIPSQRETMDEFGWVGRQAMSIYRLDKPVLCAVNGVAAGAGMSLAAACDMRIGCEKSRFKSVFIERNLSPDSGLSFFLPRIVGASRAADLIYTSRAVNAEEAYRMSLLDRLVEADELVSTAVEVAEQMLQWPPLALRMSKRVLQHSQEHDLETALRYEVVGLGVARRAENDAKESRAAFIEKRKPTYTGT
ncbi:MAG: enoyl-CoA hydratase/isomerase family protein [Chromatiales bacterium]|nr:enoyl-CoA hydratase/isomerase family protein [Chromatiales bacterium]